jgi:hypothetical protein
MKYRELSLGFLCNSSSYSLVNYSVLVVVAIIVLGGQSQLGIKGLYILPHRGHSHPIICVVTGSYNPHLTLSPNWHPVVFKYGHCFMPFKKYQLLQIDFSIFVVIIFPIFLTVSLSFLHHNPLQVFCH